MPPPTFRAFVVSGIGFVTTVRLVSNRNADFGGSLSPKTGTSVLMTSRPLYIEAKITPASSKARNIWADRNMRYWLEQDMRPVDLAVAALKDLGIAPISEPIRGGTDGSQLTAMGVPTPNLFTGMQNIHSPLEWVSVQDMARSTEVCIKLAELWGKEA